jgi:hypothetical protein
MSELDDPEAIDDDIADMEPDNDNEDGKDPCCRVPKERFLCHS